MLIRQLNKLGTGPGRQVVQRFLAPSRALATAAQPQPEAESQPEVSQEFLREWEKAKPLEEMPGPTSIPVMGTMYKYMPVVGEWDLTKWVKTSMEKYLRYGPLVREQMVPGFTTVHVFDPSMFETVFRYEGKMPNRYTMHMLVKAREQEGRSPGLTSVNGPEWYRMRIPTQKKMLQPRAVSTYLGHHEEIADDFIAYIRKIRDSNKEVETFCEETYRWSMEAFGYVCFDKRIGTLGTMGEVPESAGVFIGCVSGFLDGLRACMTNPLHEKFKTTTWKKFTGNINTLWAICGDLIIDTLDRASKGQIEHKDNITMSLMAEDQLQRIEAMGLVADMFTAGVDTTAHTLGFTVYHLARNLDKQAMLHEEVDRVYPRGTKLTRNLIDQMPLLKASIREGLRLSPSAPATGRIMPRDIVLGGYRIPKGTNMTLQFGVTSLLPEYFDDPESFIPERWLRENRKDIHPYAYIPFGHGPRVCVGRRFAEQEAYCGLAKLMQNFRIEYHYDEIGQVTRMLNAPDKPMKFCFIDR